MIERLRRRGILFLTLLCIALGLVGLFLRPDYGPDSAPGFYPLVGVLAVVTAIAVARGLTPLLKRPEDHYDAD